MKKMRYTIDYFNQQLRQKGIFSIEEVKLAIIENNGSLSVKQKEGYELVRKKDLNLPTIKQGKLPIELVLNGKVKEKKLKQKN